MDKSKSKQTSRPPLGGRALGSGPCQKACSSQVQELRAGRAETRQAGKLQHRTSSGNADWAISNNRGSLEDLRVGRRYNNDSTLRAKIQSRYHSLRTTWEPRCEPWESLTTVLSLACRHFSRRPARDWSIAAKPTRMEKAKKMMRLKITDGLAKIQHQLQSLRGKGRISKVNH